MHHWMDGWHMGWIGLWSAGAIAVGLAVLWLFARATRTGGPRDSPESLLKRRYAGGEISHDEYESKLQELRR